MYTQLLGLALDQRDQIDIGPTNGESYVAFLRSRSRLLAGASSHGKSGRALGAVTDQLAYDVALIGLAMRLGIDFDLHRFEHPHDERRSIERALVARGIPIEDFGQPS